MEKFKKSIVDLKKNYKNVFNKYLDGFVMGEIIFPIILSLVALCKIGRGFDISDTGYNYGNFVYLPGLDSMWYCSTFLANMLGRLFSFMPFGHTLIGLNFYTGLVKVALVLIAYYFFRNTVKLSSSITFFAELIAVCLCWCPTALIYNYLSYLLFFLGAMFLYKGLVDDKGKFLVIAGVCLGSNVFVRFPNICEMALIVGLWFWCFINKCKISEYFKKTGLCVAGYFGSAAVFMIIISMIKGFGGYVQAIRELFSMTDEATQYSGGGMIRGIYMAYRNTLYYQKFILAVFVLAFIIWMVGKKYKSASTGLITLLMIGLGYLLFRVNLFTGNYQEYNSIYGLGACMMGLSIVILIIPVFMKNVDARLKLLCVLSLIVIGITPLGTNNELYANFNNLFLVFPVVLYLVCNIPDWKGLFGVKFALALFICLFAYQSINFGLTFTFRDGKEMSQNTYAVNKVTDGVLTQQNKAEEILELNKLLSDHDRSILTYGDVPGAAFYFELTPALSSTWSSLPSFSTTKFTNEMSALVSRTSGEKLPYVAVDPNEYERLVNYTDELSAKEVILYSFIEEYGYEPINPDSNMMIVYDVKQR